MALSKITNASVADTAVHGRRNMVVNGGMQISQRGSSKTGVTGNGYHTVDRFKINMNSSGTFTISQSTESPEGFSNSLKLDCTTADASPDYINMVTRLEGQNVQHLKKGTANALPVTLSFWVRSSKTGTYQVNLLDEDNTRAISATYAISSANVWEHKTATFSGDTSGVLGNDNGNSLQLEWWLAAGASWKTGTPPSAWEARDNADRASGLTVNIGASTNDDFYITGVQLEVGDTATPFEHRSYGEELALCQRYFCHSNAGDTTNEPVGGFIGMAENTTRLDSPWTFPVQMRTTPAVTKLSDYTVRTNSNQTITSASFESTNSRSTLIRSTGSFVDKEAGRLYAASAGPAFSADAEL